MRRCRRRRLEREGKEPKATVRKGLTTMLLLLSKDGSAKARCESCEKLTEVPKVETQRGPFYCTPCYKAMIVAAIVRDGGKVPKWA